MTGGWLVVLAVWSARVLVLGLLGVACAYDARWRRIPNWASVGGLLSALGWHAAAPSGNGVFASASAGGLGLGASLAGTAVALVVFLALYALRAMGAGDVKMMAALGAWFGLPAVLWLVLYVLIAGGVLALARILSFGVPARSVMSNLKTMFGGGRGPDAAAGHGRSDPLGMTADRMPYAWALALGASALACQQYFG